jgi:exopolyphosphatase/guanosine-5'-triphosphate,3'-diphosphate pyrophosphatase
MIFMVEVVTTLRSTTQLLTGAHVPSTPVVGAFDIGSNTIKMTVARSDGRGGLDTLLVATDTVRLGSGVERTGRLADDRVAAALAALTRMSAQARDLGATRLIGVATAATRSATNGPAFLDQVRSGIGIDVRVIDGDEEAKLTFRGLAASIDVSGQIVVADIGGGSTELIHAVDGAVQFANSLRLGSGALTDRLVHADPPTADEISACHDDARDTIRASGLTLSGGPVRLVVVGGTGEFLARLLPQGSTLDSADIDAVIERLRHAKAIQIAHELDIPEARARVLPAGVAIVRALADEFRPAAIEVTQSGIRTGLLLAAFADHDRTSAT